MWIITQPIGEQEQTINSKYVMRIWNTVLKANLVKITAKMEGGESLQLGQYPYSQSKVVLSQLQLALAKNDMFVMPPAEKVNESVVNI